MGEERASAVTSRALFIWPPPCARLVRRGGPISVQRVGRGAVFACLLGARHAACGLGRCAAASLIVASGHQGVVLRNSRSRQWKVESAVVGRGAIRIRTARHSDPDGTGPRSTFQLPRSKVQGPRSSLCFAVHGQWKVWESSLIGTYHGCGGPFYCSTVPVPVPISIYLSKVSIEKVLNTSTVHAPWFRELQPRRIMPPSPNRWSPFSINRLRLPCALAAEEEHAIPFSRLAIPPPEHARGEEEKKRRMEE